MKLIGTLSQLNSKAGTNITNKFIKTNKFYDKQEPQEPLPAMYINVNNPNKNAIEAAKTNIIEMKHIFESGECLGGKCDIEQQLKKLENLYDAYIAYFTAAELYKTNPTNRNYEYKLIDTLLKINPLYPCVDIDSSTAGFKKIRCLTKTIEILIEAQRVYVNKINIGFLLNKAYADYNADKTNDIKASNYLKILTEYYKLFFELYARLEKTENLKTIVLKDNSIINTNKKACELIIENIRKQITIKKINSLSIINSLFIKLTTAFAEIDDNLSDDEKIEEYEKIKKTGRFILSNNFINTINKIEEANNSIIKGYEEEKTKFDESTNDSNTDLKELERKYSQAIYYFKEGKKNLIKELQEILNDN
jgi:hypothetical protein